MSEEGVEISAADLGRPVDRSSKEALEDFARHSRGKLSSWWAQRSFVRDVQISVLVATWTVILSLPVIIWPWAEYMNHGWCRSLDLAHCVTEEGPTAGVCKIMWNWSGVHCAPARPSAFLNLWGTMLLQFIFSVYVDLGSSVRFTLQGLFGTSLAYLNVMFLNRILGFFLGGGAYAHSITVGEGDVISEWLPLCNNGVRKIADDTAHCFLNLWIEKTSWLGVFSFSVVALDFTLFVVLCLSLPFNSNPRIFALSTHVSFIMTFVDPSGDSFSTEPTYATEYLEMIALAAMMVLFCFFIPKRRFTGTEAAQVWAREATELAKVLVKHLPDSLEEVLRLKAKTCLETAETTLQELKKSVNSSRFERFAWLWANEERHERLELLPSCLHRCLQRLPAIYQAAAALESSGGLSPELHQCLGQCCEAASAKLDVFFMQNDGADGEPSPEDGADAFKAAEQQFAVLWHMDKERQPEVCAFVLVVLGALAELNEVVSDFQRFRVPSAGVCSCWNLLAKFKTYSAAILFHNEDTEAIHPRFVVRNTISICLAFSIGWLGIWNVMPSYSSYAASTIAVIVYTYTGATSTVTLRRLSGVVLGKVAGSILQLGLAVKHVAYVMAFATAMWLVVAMTFFQYLHAPADLASVYGLTAAYAAASMIPSNGVLREITQNTQTSVLPTLMNTVVQTVFGIGLMLVVDTCLASKATKQARQRLVRAMDRLQHYLVACGDSRMQAEQLEATERQRTAFVKDLDALKALLPHAAAEPVYWSKPFELELFTQLEACLRRVAEHMLMLSWLTKLAGQAVLPMKSWSQLHRCWHAHVSRSWSEICGICRGMAEPRRDGDERLQEILKELAANLYTLQVANKVNLRVPNLKLPKVPGAGLRRLLHKVVHEGLDADSPLLRRDRAAERESAEPADETSQAAEADAAEAIPDSAALEGCIAAARAEALELETAETLPHESPLCAIDMASQLMRGSLEDIRTIQLALLEF
ncbi:Hypothetical protein SCF082_LOCUS14314 [Durusdinium trenchii]|uniref:Uncharacterized protein n=1 Tax=Durusdinium trenchii TaxID=1381693 RepID=A0ABP0JXN4_9DINO